MESTVRPVTVQLVEPGNELSGIIDCRRGGGNSSAFGQPGRVSASQLSTLVNW